jgi:tripeptide aminopeptidase
MDFPKAKDEAREPSEVKRRYKGMGRLVNLFKKLFRRKDTVSVTETGIKPYVDRILSDGILLNELLSPTPGEGIRGDFIRGRLDDFGIENINTDEAGNIYVIFPGSRFTDKVFLIYSDFDNPGYSPSGSIVNIKDQMLTGIGIGDNSIGASALLVLCEYIKNNDFPLQFNLLVLFSLRNTPEYNYEGINHFLFQWSGKIIGAAYLFGLDQGRVVLHSTGIYNLSFVFKYSYQDVLGKKYKDSSIDFVFQLYNEIQKIDFSVYNAIVNIVRVTAGIGFEYFPVDGTIDFEVFSPDTASLDRTREMIIELAATLGRNRNFTIDNTTVYYIPPANDVLNETLNKQLKKVHDQLKIVTRFTNIPDYTSIINQYNIPSLTIGITTGMKSEYHEYIETKNIQAGFMQVLLFLAELNKSGK